MAVPVAPGKGRTSVSMASARLLATAAEIAGGNKALAEHLGDIILADRDGRRPLGGAVFSSLAE